MFYMKIFLFVCIQHYIFLFGWRSLGIMSRHMSMPGVNWRTYSCLLVIGSLGSDVGTKCEQPLGDFSRALSHTTAAVQSSVRCLFKRYSYWTCCVYQLHQICTPLAPQQQTCRVWIIIRRRRYVTDRQTLLYSQMSWQTHVLTLAIFNVTVKLYKGVCSFIRINTYFIMC